MSLPAGTWPALAGFTVGALASAVLGFTWAGWTTAGAAETLALRRADAAVVAALAPVCVEKFQHAGDAAANLVALRRAFAWTQGEFVEKGGWANQPGTSAPEQVSAVAKACALLLADAQTRPAPAGRPAP